MTESVCACKFAMTGPTSRPVHGQASHLGVISEHQNPGKLTDACQFFSKSFFFTLETDSLRIAMTESGSKGDMTESEVVFSNKY